MSEWNGGYISEVEYTYGYYDDLNPARVELALLARGLASPKIKNACELGFGQGMSINIHAASSSVNWYGNDFIPAHTAYARELGEIAESGVQLEEDAFEEYCLGEDLPNFDYIGLHGIWTWVSDSNRKILVDFLRRKLNPGGVVYISYNTLPSWSAFIPLRNLMVQHFREQSPTGAPLAERITNAVMFAKGLAETNPQYIRAHPFIVERLKKMLTQKPDYIAHEYFNKDWQPMDFSSVATWLEPAKLDFVTSAAFLENIHELQFPPDQLQIIDTISEPSFRESTKDLLCNQQFRRDYWIKGARTLSSLELGGRFRNIKVVLLKPATDHRYVVKSRAGEAQLADEIYGPIVAAFNTDASTTIAELETRLTEQEINIGQILEAIQVLCGLGYVRIAQSDEDRESCKAKVSRINGFIKDQARSNNNIRHMASPVTGGGVSVSRCDMLFLLARESGMTTTDEWAQYAHDLLMAQGQVMMKEGKALETSDMLEAMRRTAAEFSEVRLPLLKVLEVVA